MHTQFTSGTGESVKHPKILKSLCCLESDMVTDLSDFPPTIAQRAKICCRLGMLQPQLALIWRGLPQVASLHHARYCK